MTTRDVAALPRETTETLPRGIGLPGRVAVTWALAGGLLVGGFLVAAMTLAGQLSGSGLLVTASGLFLIGAALGFAHGGALGYLGRPEGLERRRAMVGLGLAAVYTLPALAVGLVVSGWIAMTVVALYTGKTLALVAVGAAWLVGLGLVGVAAAEGWEALRNAWARWPQRRVGTALVAGSFGALLVLFLVARPEVWWLGVRVTEVGAVLLAAFVTIWAVGPMVTVGLALLDRIPAARPFHGIGDPVHGAGTVALGVVVGLLLGLLALPFYGAPLEVPTVAADVGPAGAAAVAAARALVDEVLLRLFMVTGVTWVLLRWYRVTPKAAALTAVAAAALVQVALYTPAVLAIGFPTTAAAAGFVLLAVLLPAAAFGTLYVTRGFTAAVIADATAVLAIALLAA